MMRVTMLLVVVTSFVVLAGFFFLRRPNTSATSPAEVGDMSLPPIPPPGPRRRRAWGRAGLAVVLVGLIVAAVAFVALSVGPSKDGENSQAVQPSQAATGTAGAGVQSTPGASEVAPTAVPEGVDVARIVVPSLEIDAPIVTLGVDPDGTMQSPDNPTDVAWYNFSARPGELSNVVMAGHLDYVDYGPAVFYRIKDARLGDEVQLVLVDGSVARYRVLNVTSYDEATAPVGDIVGPTEGEVVTLITCGGSFDPLSREYDKRVVLRAERIADTAQGR